MCFVCDGIAETCGWQRAKALGQALEDYFAKWEEPVCQHCDEGVAEFVDELGKFRDQSCQAGESLLTFKALQHARDDARQRAEPRKRALEPGAPPAIVSPLSCLSGLES